MFTNHRPAWVEINLDNLIFNIKNIKDKVKTKDIYAVLKADAYGHGAVEVAPLLLEAGARKLTVAIINEGIELRRAGINCPISILGITPNTGFNEIIKYDLEPSITTYDYAKELSKEAVKAKKNININIKVDTGMGRIGFLANDKSVEEVIKISELPNLKIEGIFSHFSTADECDKSYSKLQLDRFNWFCNKIIERNIKFKRYIANSAAIIDLPNTYFDAVRPGIIMYGYYPSKEVIKENLNIKPIMKLKANIIHIKTLKEGEYIGYGRKFKTKRDSLIATLPLGYADGYTRLLSNKAKVIVNGKFAPVVGSICMDQCMIDITDIEGVKVGDEVTLIGSEGDLKFDADDIADLLGTINYEVLTGIGKRIPRVYVKGGEVVKIKDYS